MSSVFVGREFELQQLKNLQKHTQANLVVVQGRRRIGKSRLIQEFSKGQLFYSFNGIAPTSETTAQMQRNEFARQMSEQFGLPKFIMEDWGDLFTLLFKQVLKNKVVILFDEISWMGSLDPMFLGKLKNAWDTQFKKNSKLMLVLCGSISSWIEENIISSTLFLGRPSLYLTVNELSLSETNQFWGKRGEHISAYEKLKFLAVTGGVPRYLELMDARISAEENIRALCFLPDSPLLNEFEFIFSDIFGKRSEVYKKIVRRLSVGAATLDQILKGCGRTKTGDFSKYLKDLEMAGFITRNFTWNIKTGKLSKLSRYRLKDNYVRFYLKYIEPNKLKIKKGLFKEKSISTLAAWESILGLQFENLVLNNDMQLVKALNIPLDDIVFMGPYFQTPTKIVEGCQVDLLIQTKFNGVYVCEVKFSKSVISGSVIDEMKMRIKRMKILKQFSCRPVLIHVNGIGNVVVETEYFANTINFSELLLHNG